MILGLCSTYDGGTLARSAVRSLLTACDRIIIADGPIGDAPDKPGEWNLEHVQIMRGRWASDADKRTAMLKRAQTYPALKWGVILDDDEALVDGQYLPEYFDALDPDAMGFSLHLMELDGSCSYIPNRVLRLDRIRRWTLSSYQFELDSGVLVSRGNLPILRGGEPEPLATLDGETPNPLAWIDTGDGVRQVRRPLAGESHILHRHVLRAPERRAFARQSDAEAATIAGVEALREAFRS